MYAAASGKVSTELGRYASILGERQATSFANSDKLSAGLRVQAVVRTFGYGAAAAGLYGAASLGFNGGTYINCYFFEGAR